MGSDRNPASGFTAPGIEKRAFNDFAKKERLSFLILGIGINPLNMETYENLSPRERSQLLKAPAYVSLLASTLNMEADEAKKKEAIELSHLRTYTSPRILWPFYTEAEKVFEKNLNELDKSLPKPRSKREQAIKSELARLEPILAKLNRVFVDELQLSLKSYAEHVSKAHGNVLVSFMIPLYLKGLTA